MFDSTDLFCAVSYPLMTGGATIFTINCLVHPPPTHTRELQLHTHRTAARLKVVWVPFDFMVYLRGKMECF